MKKVFFWRSPVMVRLPLLFFLLLSVFTGFSQATTTAKDTTATVPEDSIEVEKKPNAWEIAFNLGLNLSHTMQVNGQPNTSKRGFATTNGIDLNINYTKGRIISSNEFHWQFSLYKAGLNTITQKTADELLSLHDFSIGFSEDRIWNINVIAKTKTGIFSTYQDGFFRDTTTGKGLVQSFLNPYEVILSPGIKWQPSKALRVSLSPYTFRIYGLINQQIANTGLYIEEMQENGSDRIQQIIEQQGAALNIWYDKKFKSWVQMQYRLAVTSNYAEKLLENGAMDGLFITKIKLVKNIYLTHRATLRGQLEEKPFKPVYVQVITLSYAVTL